MPPSGCGQWCGRIHHDLFADVAAAQQAQRAIRGPWQFSDETKKNMAAFSVALGAMTLYAITMGIRFFRRSVDD